MEIDLCLALLSNLCLDFTTSLLALSLVVMIVLCVIGVCLLFRSAVLPKISESKTMSLVLLIVEKRHRQTGR